ncbi:hypothetical protein OIA45_49030 (plasmid) [Streptomyces chartreusis]|uniref:hypothetical protein n=1 Tax=Streptomyces chartreusis TaxID=1969 RepID=UPI0037DCF66C|nr:hypothetical protein OIA45_49030 [Streptomyces chartreusis]
MTEQTEYTPQPPRTQGDIDALVSFVQARVKPLRDAARYDSEECKAFQALLDLTVYVKGSAEWELSRGEDPSMQFHYLALITRQWDEHPDFQRSWDPYGTGPENA